ncbi:hypothetical protein DEI92_07225 [Curtobacterium sp. MCBD17_034]|uniref:hypothetical protein n=1 Tax=unclassified Curtobacterium TaxID=257496 RepID=UPI000DA709F5|nr:MULTISPECIES: hypothetical protein [unclassified Curtobacterium]PZF60159.1 hypothetical protein DEI92_07225 [Curtobacterium sp. MCBD17_034]PZM34844.1 hypothetical protein DEI90_05210 [Curtobacterium sp. MCBD17_031]
MHQLHSTTRFTRFVVGAATALAAAALLAGCSSSTSAGSSGSASASSASGSSSSSKLPANFPKAVPVVKGDVIVARGNASDGWSATVSPKGGKGFAQAGQALASAGFTKQGGGTATQATYTSDRYTVSISTPGSSVTYIISTR